jgi:carboxymethylenebutenolidase
MRTVEASSSQGTPAGYWAIPKKRGAPGVLVLHAWWGLNDFFKSVCDRLATAGFVAFAPDLYHGATASTIEQAEAVMSKLKRDEAREDILKGVRALQGHPKVGRKRLGVIGFSMGASWTLWLAEEHPEDVAAAVLFYGTGEAKYAKAQAAFLGHFAEKDVYESPEYVREIETSLRAIGREVTFHTYPGTTHWFFEEDRSDAYDAQAADLAWQRTIGFLTSQLSGNSVGS